MWLFALPALLINVCIIMVPALLTLMMAFFAWDGVGVPVWAGTIARRRMSTADYAALLAATRFTQIG